MWRYYLAKLRAALRQSSFKRNSSKHPTHPVEFVFLSRVFLSTRHFRWTTYLELELRASLQGLDGELQRLVTFSLGKEHIRTMPDSKPRTRCLSFENMQQIDSFLDIPPPPPPPSSRSCTFRGVSVALSFLDSFIPSDDAEDRHCLSWSESFNICHGLIYFTRFLPGDGAWHSKSLRTMAKFRQRMQSKLLWNS